MVKCEECGKDMSSNKTKSCTFDYIEIGDELYLRDTTYFDVNKRCHDCGIENKKGNVHHFGCDIERCPKCKGQLISCGCFGDDRTIMIYRNKRNFHIMRVKGGIK